jgi:CheY-like chemotaxis protein/DNA-binding XRE family transcriptional regulator
MKEKQIRYQKVAQHIGRQLQKRRKKVGLSLENLAAKIDISHQQLHKYEKAANSIPADKLYYLSVILGVPFSYFFEGFVEHKANAAGSKQGEALNILVVEDDPGDAVLVREALKQCEKENNVYLLHDGREALNYLNNRSADGDPLPDLVFLDLNIPSLEGFSLLQEIKKKSSLSHIPVIIMTSSLDDEDVARSYKNQASGMLRKTGDREEFNKHIASLVDCWSTAMTLPTS